MQQRKNRRDFDNRFYRRWKISQGGRGQRGLSTIRTKFAFFCCDFRELGVDKNDTDQTHVHPLPHTNTPFPKASIQFTRHFSLKNLVVVRPRNSKLIILISSFQSSTERNGGWIIDENIIQNENFSLTFYHIRIIFSQCNFFDLIVLRLDSN